MLVLFGEQEIRVSESVCNIDLRTQWEEPSIAPVPPTPSCIISRDVSYILQTLLSKQAAVIGNCNCAGGVRWEVWGEVWASDVGMTGSRPIGYMMVVDFLPHRFTGGLGLLWTLLKLPIEEVWTKVLI